jgi:hypothetical protein
VALVIALLSNNQKISVFKATLEKKPRLLCRHGLRILCWFQFLAGYEEGLEGVPLLLLPLFFESISPTEIAGEFISA